MDVVKGRLRRKTGANSNTVIYPETSADQVNGLVPFSDTGSSLTGGAGLVPSVPAGADSDYVMLASGQWVKIDTILPFEIEEIESS